MHRVLEVMRSKVYPSQWKAIESITKKLSINHETWRVWVRRAETDAGQRPGLTSDERAQMKALERETKSCAERTKRRCQPVSATISVNLSDGVR